MNNINELSVGVFGPYWEYRRGIYRRLFESENFSEDDALHIGRLLEGVNKLDYSHEIKYGEKRARVYIDEHGIATYLKK